MSGSSTAIIINSDRFSVFKPFEFMQFNIKSAQNSPIFTLPMELLVLISSWLSLADIFSLQQTCTLMYNQVSEFIKFTCRIDHIEWFSRKISRSYLRIDGILTYYKYVLSYLDSMPVQNSLVIVSQDVRNLTHRNILIHCLQLYKQTKNTHWQNVIEYIISVYGTNITDLIHLCVMTCYEPYYDKWAKTIGPLTRESMRTVLHVFETVIRFSVVEILDKIIKDFPIQVSFITTNSIQKILELSISKQNPIVFKKLLDHFGNQYFKGDRNFDNILVSINEIPAPNHLTMFKNLLECICSISNIYEVESVVKHLEEAWSFVVIYNRVDLMKILCATEFINIYSPSASYLICLVIKGNAEHNWSKDILDQLLESKKTSIFTSHVSLQLFMKECIQYDNVVMFHYFLEMYPKQENFMATCFVMSIEKDAIVILKYLIDKIHLDSNQVFSTSVVINNFFDATLFSRCIHHRTIDDFIITHLLTSPLVIPPTVETLSIIVFIIVTLI